jgi:hypothetical protein
VVFRRLLPRLGYQSAIWAVAHRLCRVVWKILHQGVRFIEYGIQPDPQAKKRHARRLAQALRKLGYDVATSRYLGERSANAEDDFRSCWSQFPTFVWIASSCGGVWFPKADLAQLPRGHRPALRPP